MDHRDRRRDDVDKYTDEVLFSTGNKVYGLKEGKLNMKRIGTILKQN